MEMEGYQNCLVSYSYQQYTCIHTFIHPYIHTIHLHTHIHTYISHITSLTYSTILARTPYAHACMQGLKIQGFTTRISSHFFTSLHLHLHLHLHNTSQDGALPSSPYPIPSAIAHPPPSFVFSSKILHRRSLLTLEFVRFHQFTQVVRDCQLETFVIVC